MSLWLLGRATRPGTDENSAEPDNSLIRLASWVVSNVNRRDCLNSKVQAYPAGKLLLLRGWNMGIAGTKGRNFRIKTPNIDPRKGMIGDALHLLRGFAQLGFWCTLLIGGPFAWILRDGHMTAHTVGWEAVKRTYDCYHWGATTVWLLLALLILRRLTRPDKIDRQEVVRMHRSPSSHSDSAPQHVVDWMD